MAQVRSLCLSILFALSFLLGGCQTQPTAVSSPLELIPVSYKDLPGWDKDKILKAVPALKRSCETLLKKDPTKPMATRRCGGGQVGDWRGFCTQIVTKTPQTEEEIRRIIQRYLKPYQASSAEGTTGLFTGYDEPELRGSKRRHGRFQTPLYRLPGSKVRYKGVPRSRIVAGALKGKGLELVWVDDPIDAFFLQIQGSGRVRLEDGSLMRLGYAGQNGCAYYVIGKALIQKGALSPGDVSRQSIRKWLRQHPRQAESIMSLNKSYVFFKIRHGEGPVGSHGVPLTPLRSLAIDKEHISLGTPLWINIDHPNAGTPRIQSLVVAQDTGGAIKGGIRGDLFWGSGPTADDCAGRMKSHGEYFLLLPK